MLLLTKGGAAELIDPDDETVWYSADDEDFLGEFPAFLRQSDVSKVLDFLVDVGELSELEADEAEVREEFLKPEDLSGIIPG